MGVRRTGPWTGRARRAVGRCTTAWLVGIASAAASGAPFALATASAVVMTGCPKSQGYVGLRLYRTRETPRDAQVYIDEQYIGPLGPTIRRGVRFPVGEHRITVIKEGYFPWDKLVVADREVLKIQVELVPIPD